MPAAPPPEGPPVCKTSDCLDHGKVMERVGTVQDDKGRPFQQYGCPTCLQKTMRALD
jgi:hypothetical protein